MGWGWLPGWRCWPRRPLCCPPPGQAGGTWCWWPAACSTAGHGPGHTSGPPPAPSSAPAPSTAPDPAASPQAATPPPPPGPLPGPACPPAAPQTAAQCAGRCGAAAGPGRGGSCGGGAGCCQDPRRWALGARPGGRLGGCGPAGGDGQGCLTPRVVSPSVRGRYQGGAGCQDGWAGYAAGR
ncbi:hypothetical protein V8C86DRAFT_2826891 [Haematococcus lacustris]